MLSARTTFKNKPKVIFLKPDFRSSNLNKGFLSSWGMTSFALNMGPATSCGKKVT